MTQQNTQNTTEHVNAIREGEEKIREHINALIEDGYSIYDIAEIMEHSVDWVRGRR